MSNVPVPFFPFPFGTDLSSLSYSYRLTNRQPARPRPQHSRERDRSEERGKVPRRNTTRIKIENPFDNSSCTSFNKKTERKQGQEKVSV